MTLHLCTKEHRLEHVGQISPGLIGLHRTNPGWAPFRPPSAFFRLKLERDTSINFFVNRLLSLTGLIFLRNRFLSIGDCVYLLCAV